MAVRLVCNSSAIIIHATERFRKIRLRTDVQPEGETLPAVLTCTQQVVAHRNSCFKRRRYGNKLTIFSQTACGTISTVQQQTGETQHETFNSKLVAQCLNNFPKSHIATDHNRTAEAFYKLVMHDQTQKEQQHNLPKALCDFTIANTRAVKPVALTFFLTCSRQNKPN